MPVFYSIYNHNLTLQKRANLRRDRIFEYLAHNFCTMMKKLFYSAVLGLILTGCGTVQKVIKSSFPYTTTLNIPTTAKAGIMASSVSLASSFDQNFKKDGNNASRLGNVRMASAKMQASNPSDYNIGNIESLKLYMAKPDGSGEVLIASRNDIGNNAGSSLILDIDNSNNLSELVRQPNVRVKMVYKLRKSIDLDVNLKVKLDLKADAGN